MIADRYRIETLIGEGGVARVYRGTDTTLDRRVAIKVLRPELSDREDVVARFRREAHAAAKLNHPNIVQIYDTGVDDGRYYIVMEYLPELNLKEIIKRYAPLPLDKVIEVAEACCQALAYAHRQGLVHRDVKPHNVLFTDDGRAKLSDFGIAAAAGETGLTDDGKVLGSAHYISPEQAQGARAGPLSDIYSLGVTLYEALTGRLPFGGETAADIAAQHLRESPPSPREINPEIPPAAEYVIMKAMARDPQRRYRSAETMLTDVHKLERGVDLDQTGVLEASPEATVPLPRSAEPSRPRRAAQEEPAAAPSRPAAAQRREEAASSAAGTAMAGVGVGLLALLVIVAVVWLVKAAFYPHTGPTMVEVPNVKGLTEQQAREDIEERGLAMGRIEHEYNDLQPVGRVTEQSPEPGQTVQSGTAIDLWVNRGKQTVSVIDVVGTRPERAQALLEAANLTLGEAEEYFHETEPAGVIFDQEPKPGTRVDTGTPIDVSVSKGPEEEQPEEGGDEEPGDEETQPALEETVEGGGEAGERRELVTPRVYVEETEGYKPDQPQLREFSVQVVAMGETSDQEVEVSYRDETGATLIAGAWTMQPGETNTVRLQARGTVTIEVRHEGVTVFEETRQVKEGAERTE
ncbi:MAG: Stk1 family PASTA domain-containing Ser/Thr kinase [Armatimonadota bacterium]|nr:Stk1 family PASTA domain-containing Ser/Thr kinase [Armatimonadota bacterium]